MSANSNEPSKAVSAKRNLLRWSLRALILASCLWLIFTLAGRFLRRVAIKQISELTNAEIRAKSVNFGLNASVSIKGLVVTPNKESGYDDTILKAEKVHARFGIGSLLLLHPRLKQINIKDFVFTALQDVDTGRWNVSALKINATKGRSSKMPVVYLQAGRLQYSRVSKGQVEVVAQVPFDVRFRPTKGKADAYSFKITMDQWAYFGKSTLTGSWQPGGLTFTAEFSSANVPLLKRIWTINALTGQLEYDTSNTCSLGLKIRGLHGRDRLETDKVAFDSRPFLEKFGLYNAVQGFFDEYHPTGLIDIDLDASGSLDRLGESALRGALYCRDVSVYYSEFKYPIEHLTGRIDFTEKSALLNNLHGLHKGVKLVFNGFSSDFGPNLKYQIQFTSDNMALDDDLYNALSEEKRKFWSVFSPSGLVAINYSCGRSQANKKTVLAVKLLGTGAVCRYFPYPLKNLTGILLFGEEGVTASDVVSQSNGNKIIMNGKIAACDTDRPICDIDIKAENVPLDSTLGQALPPRQKNLYNRLGISGLADANVKVFTPQQDSKPTSFIADVSFRKTTLQFQPLVVSDIQGKGVFTPNSIHIESSTGRYDGGPISLTGRIWSETEDEPFSYCLSLDAEQMPLKEDLFGLLPAPLKKIVSALRPSGKLDYHLDFSMPGVSDRPDYNVAIDCRGGNVSFQPFPYPLKDITGNLTITKDSINLKNITAIPTRNVQITPNTSMVRISGRIDLADDAFSRGTLQLNADDIYLDEQLGTALPKGIQGSYFKLSPVGRFDLNDVNIEIVSTKTSEKQVSFKGGAKLKDCSFNLWLAEIKLDGILNELKGSYKTAGGFCDIQSPVTADCYGGRLTGKFELTQLAGSAWEYLLRVGFDNIDLKQFLAAHKQTKETYSNGYTSGEMDGSLSITGRTDDVYSRIGRCRLLITDMQVGKLSPLAKLLHVLKLTEPKDFAFDQMLVDSYIQRDKLFVEKFDLSGQALAFNGSGWMDLQDRNINLTLTARGRRLATAEPSVLQSLTEGLGQAVVRMDVTGNLYDPQITTTALPVIKGTLEILGTKTNRP